MTALGEILAARAGNARARGTVEAGALGSVTLEALPIREIERLSRGADANRAMFYAACREMQSAGAALLREGKVYRPDQVMALVSDAEAAIAAEAVRTLSGWPGAEADGGTAPAVSPAENAADGGAGAGEAAEASVPGTAASAGAERESAASSAAAGTGEDEPAFHEPEAQPVAAQEEAVPVKEIRQGFAQAAGWSRPISHGPLTQGREAERPTEEVPSGSTTDMSQSARTSGKADGGPQAAEPVFLSERAASKDGKIIAGEYAPESVRTPREAMTESAAQDRKAPHEGGPDRAETIHETTSDLAERVARELLDGLRRASWVR